MSGASRREIGERLNRLARWRGTRVENLNRSRRDGGQLLIHRFAVKHLRQDQIIGMKSNLIQYPGMALQSHLKGCCNAILETTHGTNRGVLLHSVTVFPRRKASKSDNLRLHRRSWFGDMNHEHNMPRLTRPRAFPFQAGQHPTSSCGSTAGRTPSPHQPRPRWESIRSCCVRLRQESRPCRNRERSRSW